MAKITSQLTATEVKNAKAKGKEYALRDGHGLTLRVSPTGSKRWLFNYSKPYTKKRSNMGLGAYPAISLAKARELAADARVLLADNIDPIEHRDAEELRHRQSKVHTLLAVAKEWHKVKATKVSEMQASKIWDRLGLHVFPKLGSRPIREISRMEVIEVLRDLEQAGKLDMLKRLCQNLNQIMTYAANTGYVEGNNLTGIISAFKTPKVVNMPTLRPEELPELTSAIYSGRLAEQTRLLIEFQLLTMARPGEAAGARWDEICESQKLWTIPAKRMKMRRVHKVPLSAQALVILARMKQISGKHEYVFPKRGDPLGHASSQTANQALKRLGFAKRLVSHGMRSIASTTLNEQGFASDLVEVALAHLDSNDVRAAYNRAEYLDRRRVMMEWWGQYVATAYS
ncbi:integrase arm-type DNA-binding domain-containing protein [Ferrimonas pelagia]|uniref:Integrase domain-containing protein n=1 Tax=Ferrimonas pelagia TaxID=1177826 RepID=A0ABP9E9H9_9GAMM